MSFHQRVPTEIWGEIFSTLCSTLHHYSFKINYHTKHGEEPPVLDMPALLLSQVCTRWRVIAENSPGLWSSISVELSDLPFDISSPLELYFARSKARPLDLHLSRRKITAFSRWDGRDGAAVWRIFSRHLARCKDLGILTFDGFDFPEIPDLSFPNLRVFYENILLLHNPSPSQDFWLWRALRQAPKLTTTICHNLNLMFPFAQLTSLSLRVPADKEIELLLHVLPACQRLEELSLIYLFNKNWTAEPEAFTPVEAPCSLRKLRLKDDNPPLEASTVLPRLLTALTIPSLQHFDLECQDWPPPLVSMVKRSPLIERVNLTMLAPIPSNMSTCPLVPFLQCVPNMTTFELELEESEAVEEGNTAAGSSDELLYTLLSTLVGTEPGDHDYYPPAFLPKLQYVSLRLPNLTLDETVVDKVRETVLESVMNVYCDSSDKMLEEFWLTRTSAAQNDDTAKVTALLHSPFLSKTLKELEENWGVSVVIEDCAHPVLA